MDTEKAQQMLLTLQKSGVAGWQVLDFIDSPPLFSEQKRVPIMQPSRYSTQSL
ncbi:MULTISPECIES: hypothetical protein [unclassified Mesorhizobium]|uniref:hypothetical protein n=1 Tax=unclassified Mesorhizobium TaxID=325217 RepID=UPI00143F17A5|nr:MULTISPECIES: hypothetical protein [unclassified Mesorhizobium]